MTTQQSKQRSHEISYANLMRKVQDGDGPAYSALLTEVVPVLRRTIRARRGFLSAADVEDLVQDILLSVHAVRATYDPKRPFMPWLMAILHNRMVDAARRHARSGAHELAVEKYPETFSANETNIEETFGNAEALRQAIGGLPPQQRKAIEMLKLQELSLKEASAASNMTVSALKVAAHRGMQALRLGLKREGGS